MIGALVLTGVAYGAIESEQLAWGSPWLGVSEEAAQLAAALALQREAGRRLFLVGESIPGLAGVDLVLDTDGRAAEDVAAEIRHALRARGLLGPQ